MIKAVLIDDEPLARTIVKEYLEQFPAIEVAAECNNGFEGFKTINQTKPDLVFLDIQMPKINGFEMLELIEEPPAVIFTTAFDEFAMKAFESNAIDYLLKPFSPERFSKAVQKFLDSRKSTTQNVKVDALLETAAKTPQQSQRVVVKTGGNIKIISIPDIIYLEAADDYVKIHTKDGAYLKNKTMAHFEQTLPQTQFVRTHRSYIVNVQQITRIDPYEKDSQVATIKSGERIPVSKSGYAKLKGLLGI
jgi:two-component system, LytTR family, response regulator